MPEVVSRKRRHVIAAANDVVVADVKNVPKLENVTSVVESGGTAAGKSRKKREIEVIDLTEDEAPPKRIKMEPVFDMSPTTQQMFAGDSVASHTVVKVERVAAPIAVAPQVDSIAAQEVLSRLEI